MTKSLTKVAVIGHPINHSKSPMIHNHWILKYGLSGEYKAIDIPLENFKRDISDLIDKGYEGFNVTIPHKQNILSLCDDVDDVATKIGAVNTVKIKDRKLYGTNTDAFGFIENLKTKEPFFQKDKSVLILGAGGASRAIVYGLMQEGFQDIIVTNRTMDKANDLKNMNPNFIRVLPWDERSYNLKNIGLLVNTTSLGMTGKESLDFDFSGLQEGVIVCDIVYTPLMTPLLSKAKDENHHVVTGIGMLLHQARPAFQSWFGVMPDIDEDLIKKVLS